MTLSISVIIPTRNEARRLGELLDCLLIYPELEILIVDGESEDETRAIAAARDVKVISTAPGRGLQLHEGALQAAGDILFFLHCDTLPPPDFPDLIRQTLIQPNSAAGAFLLAFDDDHFRFRMLAKVVNFRSTFFQLPYGDQGLFVTREIYELSGGFPLEPLFEDVVLVGKLRRFGKIRINQTPMTTSARRWLRHGFLATSISNQLFFLAYQLGVAPKRLARWYYRIK